MEHKLNNGYVFIASYMNDPTLRVFGPYKTPLTAFREAETWLGTKLLVSEKELNKGREFRPVIGRKYRVNTTVKNMPLEIEIGVLEFDLNKNKPKD